MARGYWDGFSDTDLLVVAANQDAAERAADQLAAALVAEDVLAIHQAVRHGAHGVSGCS